MASVSETSIADILWQQAKENEHSSIPASHFVDENPKDGSKDGFEPMIHDSEAYLIYAGKGERISTPQSDMVFISSNGGLTILRCSEGDLERCRSCGAEKTNTGNQLLQCLACKGVAYCSKECQKLDWKFHKKNCGTEVKYEGAWSETIECQNVKDGHTFKTPYPSANPSTKSEADDPYFLKNLPKDDVYHRIIDAHRLQIYDIYLENADKHGIYCSKAEAFNCWQIYMWHVDKMRDILPDWWTLSSSAECALLATMDNKS